MNGIQWTATIIAVVSLLYLLKGILIPVLLPLLGLWVSYRLFRYSQRK